METKKIFLWVIITSVIAAGSYFLYQRYVALKEERAKTFAHNIRLNEAYKIHNQGDFEKSLKALDATISQAPSEAAANDTNLIKAIDLFRRNQGDDRIKAVEIWKSIINDASALPVQRAIAINQLLDRFNNTRDFDLAKKYIFSGDPLEKLLQNGDILLAIRKAYEYSDTIYPYSLTEFRIAKWYAIALRQKDYKDQTQKEEYLAQLKSWTKRGQENMPSALKLRYGGKAALSYLYELEADNLWTIAFYTDKKYRLVEEKYRQGLDALRPEDSDVDSFGHSLFHRFYYALMLAKMYGKNRSSDVKQILAPIVSPVPEKFKGYPFGFFEFLKSQSRDDHKNTASREDVVFMQKFSPEFKNLLGRLKISLD